jgi:peptidoglycan/LPS O-acetylase OafA/YrhL
MERTKTGAEPRRIPELDGLRGLAILFVLSWHYLAIHVQAPRRSVLALMLLPLRLAWSGVDLFFVLSGFLIGGILVDARRSPNYFATFYRRRFFRIVPLYAALSLAFWACILLGAQRWNGTVGHALFANPIPWYAFPLFLQNAFVAYRGTFEPLATGVMWSLAIEEQFYLTFPFLVRYLSPRQLPRVLVGIMAVAPILRCLAVYGLPHGGVAAYVLTPMRADSLAAGALAAILVRSDEARAALVRHRAALRAAVGVLLLGAAGFILRRWTTHESPAMCIIGYSWLCWLYVLVLLLAVTGPDGRLAGLLRARWLRSLGEIAFGAYLIHVAALCVCFGVFLGREPTIENVQQLAVTLVAATVTIVLARASWVLFERRMVRIGQRYAYAAPEEKKRESLAA